MSDSSYALAEPQESISRSTYGRIGVALSSMLIGFGLGCMALNVFGRAEEPVALLATTPARAAALLPGSGPWKELALTAMEANNRCEVGGPRPTPRFTAALANVRSKDVEMLGAQVAMAKKRGSTIVAMAARRSAPRKVATKKVAPRKASTDGPFLSWKDDDRVGAFPPFGYWDPLGFAATSSAGQVAWFREAELKHGRICMLATVGFVVGERFHPLFGGDIDVPAMQAPAQVELQLFWPAVLGAIGAIELATSAGMTEENDDVGFAPSLAQGRVPGDLGFDPLGLASRADDKTLREYQNKELAHGRMAMIATLGMILQELIIPEQKLYGA